MLPEGLRAPSGSGEKIVGDSPLHFRACIDRRAERNCGSASPARPPPASPKNSIPLQLRPGAKLSRVRSGSGAPDQMRTTTSTPTLHQTPLSAPRNPNQRHLPFHPLLSVPIRVIRGQPAFRIFICVHLRHLRLIPLLNLPSSPSIPTFSSPDASTGIVTWMQVTTSNPRGGGSGLHRRIANNL